MCFFSTRGREGKEKISVVGKERDRTSEVPRTFIPTRRALCEQGSPFPFIDRLDSLTSSLFPRPRNRRVERFVKSGDRATGRPETFPPCRRNESASTLLLARGRKKNSHKAASNEYSSVSEIN